MTKQLKYQQKVIVGLLSVFCCFGLIQHVAAQNQALTESVIVYRYSGKVLTDSKWGKILRLQEALAASLISCGKEGLTPDGKLGKDTTNALVRLLMCPGFESLVVPEDHSLYGGIHSVLWQVLLPEVPLPTVHDRAFVLSLSHEATDYDRVEWNYGTKDEKSGLTWGPYGATVGYGHEVHAIVKHIYQADAELVETVFAEDAPAIIEFIEADPAEGLELLRPVYQNEQSRKRWKEHFRALGAIQQVREAYDWYAFQSDQWLKPNFRRLYSLIPDAASTATEIDYAFFLDLAMHASITKDRIERCQKALTERADDLGRDLTPSERRQIIGQVFVEAVSQNWQNDRLARNIAYYIDGFGAQNLSREVVKVWQVRSDYKASDCGLSDKRLYYPDFLK